MTSLGSNQQGKSTTLHKSNYSALDDDIDINDKTPTTNHGSELSLNLGMNMMTGGGLASGTGMGGLSLGATTNEPFSRGMGGLMMNTGGGIGSGGQGNNDPFAGLSTGII